MKRRVETGPNEGYTLPPSSKRGGKFVDFNRIIERKPVKRVIKIKKND